MDGPTTANVIDSFWWTRRSISCICMSARAGRIRSDQRVNTVAQCSCECGVKVSDTLAHASLDKIRSRIFCLRLPQRVNATSFETPREIHRSRYASACCKGVVRCGVWSRGIIQYHLCDNIEVLCVTVGKIVLYSEAADTSQRRGGRARRRRVCVVADIRIWARPIDAFARESGSDSFCLSPCSFPLATTSSVRTSRTMLFS
ncbi:hypothetical protein BV20DRAFT_369606 [Pilatotrama ljubarskyi]|nr:hypothetical protein BV20DRAFT_369606 [Pilatotrama ljubarskyi]